MLVALVLGPVFGAGEFVAHWVLDCAKSMGWMGGAKIAFYVDQALHIAVKLVWLGLWLAWSPSAPTVL